MIVLPLPPSVNGAYGGGSGQKRFKSKKYKEWEKGLQGLKIPPFKSTGLVYTFYFPDKRARDILNYTKVLTDFLVKAGGLIDDDWRYLTEVNVRYGGIDKDNPRVEIKEI